MPTSFFNFLHCTTNCYFIQLIGIHIQKRAQTRFDSRLTSFLGFSITDTKACVASTLSYGQEKNNNKISHSYFIWPLLPVFNSQRYYRRERRGKTLAFTGKEIAQERRLPSHSSIKIQNLELCVRFDARSKLEGARSLSFINLSFHNCRPNFA